MKKQINKVTCVVIIITIFFAFTNDSLAWNVEKDIVTKNGIHVSREISLFLEKNGIKLTEEDEIYIVESNKDDQDVVKALKIVRDCTEFIETTILSSIVESEDERIMVGSVPLLITSANDSHYITYEPNHTSLNNLMYVIGRAVYTVSGNSLAAYFHPTQTSSTYYKRQSCTVSRLCQNFLTAGYKCNSSGYILDYEYEHNITIDMNFPLEAYAYLQNGALPNGQKIQITGNRGDGVFLAFEVTVNNILVGKSFPL